MPKHHATNIKQQYHTLRQALRKIRRKEASQFGAFEYGVMYGLTEMNEQKLNMFSFLNMFDVVIYSLEDRFDAYNARSRYYRIRQNKVVMSYIEKAL